MNVCECINYSYTHSLKTINDISTYYLETFVIEDYTENTLIKEYDFSYGYTSWFHGKYWYDSYYKNTHYITYTKKDYYSEVSIILEEYIY